MTTLSLALSRGDVVLISASFDRVGKSSLRPAVVLQADTLDPKPGFVVVAIITSTQFRAQPAQTHLFIDAATEDGFTTGLLHNSIVKCECLATVDRRDIRRLIGSLSRTQQVYLDIALRAALDL